MTALRARSRRGALMLEVVLSLAIFVSVGFMVLAVVGRATDELRIARARVMAADIAKSAMSKLEGGIVNPETLDGPVPEWEPDEGLSAAVPTGPPAGSGWFLHVETEPSAYRGLTLVTVTASNAKGTAAFTLKQLVHIASRGEDEGIGDADPAAPESAP